MADREVEDALARSFLADLPPELTGRLRAEGERADYPAGTTVYQAGSAPQAGLVVGGLLRVYLMSVQGRQVTVRYARPGDVLGVAVLVGGPASTSVQAVEASSLFRISARTLTAAARNDPRVSWAIAGELNRRLYDTLEQTAVNAFGSVRQRVAAHLLDLASAQQHPCGRLVARVSQQELADATFRVNACCLRCSVPGWRPRLRPTPSATTSATQSSRSTKVSSGGAKDNPGAGGHSWIAARVSREPER
jgi:CRP/FNR family transcriptional regulator, cyclic AMP receptor protein